MVNKDLPHNTITNKPDTHTDTTKPSPADVKPSRKQNDGKRDDVVVGEEGEQQPTGPGPKPLATVAKEHGGDAGNLQVESKSKGPGSSKDASAKAAADDKDEENQGTGELYVRTSGLAADGGDFDASRPGAGREADRKFFLPTYTNLTRWQAVCRYLSANKPRFAASIMTPGFHLSKTMTLIRRKTLHFSHLRTHGRKRP